MGVGVRDNLFTTTLVITSLMISQARWGGEISEFTAIILKKRSKTHKGLKRMLFNWTKRVNFPGSPVFPSYVQKNRKTISSLSFCQHPSINLT